MATRRMGLLQKKAALVAEGRKIIDAVAARDKDGAPGVETAEEAARLNAIDAEAAQVVAALAREEAQIERERAAGHAVAETEEAQASKPTVKAAPKPFRSFGEQLIAIANYSQGKGVHPGLMAIQAAASGSSEGVPADGGFLVQQDFATTVLDGMMTGGELLSRVFNVPMSGTANGIKINTIDETNRANGSRWGGIRAYWAAEAATVTASAPKFRRAELNLHKLFGLFYATDELLADAAALEAVARRGFEEELRFKAEDAIFRGTGAGQPLGILGASGTVSQAKETGQVAATVVAENIMKMWARMPAPNRKNAVWLINQEVEPQLDKMYIAVGTGGIPVYMPPAGLSQNGYGTLKGRPVIPVEYCEAPGTVGDIVLADFSEYLMISRGTPDWASSMHVKFLTDEMTFRMIWRADGQPARSAAITPYKGNNTLSPFVTLATRA
ncbi:MAG: hypothetical protein RJA55_601 [Acidobacteriota bacterium]|jgi:HK97 family phage major capsid protein